MAMMPPTHIVDPDENDIEPQPLVEQRELSVENNENDVTPKFPARQKDMPTPDEAPANESPPDGDSSGESTAQSLHVDCFRIQVSAEHLICASPFFQNMLSGGWKESAHYLQSGSVEIIAEGWDIEALLILLRAAHGHLDQVPQELSLEMLAKVATIADYYMCKECLSSVTDRWLGYLKTRVVAYSRRDMALWIWIGWFFESPELFKRFTSLAMSMCKGTFTSFGLPIPGRVIVAINKGREDGLDHLITRLNQARLAYLDGTEGCDLERHSRMYEFLTMKMQRHKLLSPNPMAPFCGMTYLRTMTKIKSFISPRRGIFGYDPHYKDMHKCPQTSSISKISLLNAFLKGLELKDFTV
ncbi:hypothetical protein N7454_005332 [Penicillium verhagenii]|nr:hypothetical protein N7454_005332 [Penicillium verhagenii]